MFHYQAALNLKNLSNQATAPASLQIINNRMDAVDITKRMKILALRWWTVGDEKH